LRVEPIKLGDVIDAPFSKLGATQLCIAAADIPVASRLR
jgi:hypothetical protein